MYPAVFHARTRRKPSRSRTGLVLALPASMKLRFMNAPPTAAMPMNAPRIDRKSTRLNSSHVSISYAVFCLKKKKESILAQAQQSPSHGTEFQDLTKQEHA